MAFEVKFETFKNHNWKTEKCAQANNKSKFKICKLLMAYRKIQL